MVFESSNLALIIISSRKSSFELIMALNGGIDPVFVSCLNGVFTSLCEKIGHFSYSCWPSTVKDSQVQPFI